MDLHGRFTDWLADGAEGEPPRDLALHASTCGDCMRAVAAVDSLRAIDVGAASLPPLRRVAEVRPRPFDVARLAVSGLAVILLGAIIAVATSGFFRGTPPADEPERSAEGVLAGAPSDDSTDRPARDTPSPSPSGSPTPSQSPTDAPSLEATAAPPQPAPRTPAPQPPAPTAAPTAAPTTALATPAPPPAIPTPSPASIAPTSSATPSPSASEVITLPACSNLVDDDDDGEVDFPLDPGCTGPEDDDETDSPPP